MMRLADYFAVIGYDIEQESNSLTFFFKLIYK